MALTPSVGTGQIITPTWGNEIRDRTNQVFATITERDTAFPTPVAGQRCYVTATKNEYEHDGTAWKAIGRVVGRAGVAVVGAAYDATKPVWTMHGRAAVTTDANGFGNIDLAGAGITGVTGLLNVQLTAVVHSGSGYFPQVVWVASASTLSNINVRAFTATGTAAGAGTVQMMYAIVWQGNPPA